LDRLGFRRTSRRYTHLAAWSRIIRALVLSAAGFMASPSVHATDLFRACDTVQAEKSFQALSEYFDGHAGDHFECLALSRDAFVFTNRGNFEDCRLDKATEGLRCSVADRSIWYPDLELRASFSGAGKHFALFHVEQLKGGTFGEGYHVFYLVPRQVDQRGYRIFFLEGAGAQDQSDSEGKCASAADLQDGQEVSDVTVAGSPPFQILDEGQSDVTIQFNQQIIRCKTGQVVADRIAYRWVGDRLIKMTGK